MNGATYTPVGTRPPSSNDFNTIQFEVPLKVPISPTLLLAIARTHQQLHQGQYSRPTCSPAEIELTDG